MALTASSIFSVQATATTGNVNGAGFNPANANMLTNLAADTNTGNTASPIVSSASYNFVAGDVGNWVYIKAGTNWTVGWYQIASVAANKATLSAAIGSAQVITNGFKAASTVIGCATVATPTSGTFTIDYSQADTAKVNAVADFTGTGSSTTLTSATASFNPVMVGNYFHQTTTGTGAHGLIGWYEIVSYTNVTTVVLDRTMNDATASVACTGYVGGAGRFNALEDAFVEMLPAGAHVWVKNGTYTFSGVVTQSSSAGTAALPIIYIGYNTIPGDSPKGSSRPVWTLGASAMTLNNYNSLFNIIVTGTAAVVFTGDPTGSFSYCKFANTSSVAARSAFSVSGCIGVMACEFISQNGPAIATSGTFYGCYFHDSDSAINASFAGLRFIDCIVANMLTAGLVATSGSGTNIIEGCTFYGRSVTPTGVGISMTGTCVNNRFFNNIITGWATGISNGALTLNNTTGYNDYYNNTADTSAFNKDSSDLAVNPSFADIAEIAITNGTATGGTAVLTSSGADFSTVEDNVDFFRLLSQSGGTGTYIQNYLITSHTTTTLTFNINMGSSGSATSITGFVQTGHDYTVGAALKAKGFPGLFGGSATTSYLDTGAAQRIEPAIVGNSSTFVG